MENTAPVETAAPAAEPATPETAPARNRADAVTRAREAFKQALVARAEAKAQPSAQAEPAVPEPAPAAEPAKTEPPKAEPAPAPAPADMAAAIAKAVQESLAADRSRFETEQRAKSLEAELASERARIAKVNEDPFRKAILDGRTYEEITQDIVAEKFKPLTPEEKRFQALQEEVAQARAKSEALEKRLQEDDAARKRAERLQTTKEKISQSAERFPFVSALDWMHEQAVNLHSAREGDGVDLDTILGEQNAAVQEDLRRVISSDAALKQLFSDETIKNRVLAVLGTASTPKPSLPAEQAVAAPKPPSSEGPKAIPTRKVGESGERVSRKAPTAEERRANAAAMFKRLSGK